MRCYSRLKLWFLLLDKALRGRSRKFHACLLGGYSRYRRRIWLFALMLILGSIASESLVASEISLDKQESTNVQHSEKLTAWPHKREIRHRLSVVATNYFSYLETLISRELEKQSLLKVALALKGNMIEIDSEKRDLKTYNPPIVVENNLYSGEKILFQGCRLRRDRVEQLIDFKRSLEPYESLYPAVRLLRCSLKYRSLNELIAEMKYISPIKHPIEGREIIINFAKHHLRNALIHALGRERLKITGGNKIVIESIDYFWEENAQLFLEAP